MEFLTTPNQEKSYKLTQKIYKSYIENFNSEIIPITKNDLDKLNFDKGVNYQTVANTVYNTMIGGSVYLVHMVGTDYYKIGISSQHENLFNRLTRFKTSSPFDFEFVCYSFLEKGISEPASYVESFLHKFFDKNRIKREWFRLNKIEVDAISNFICYELEVWDCFQNEKYTLQES